MSRICASFALIVGALGCGGPHVQRASVRSPSPMQSRRAEPQAEPQAGLDANADPEIGPRWIVSPTHARFEIRAKNPFLDQVFTFARYRARVVGDGKRAFEFHAEIETGSLEGGTMGIASLVKAQFLEVSLFPRATFDGTVRSTTGADPWVVDGVLDLHGVSRALRFDATVHQEPGGLRLLAVFDVPRKPFHMRLAGAWDAFVPDHVRVTLDVYASQSILANPQLHE